MDYEKKYKDSLTWMQSLYDGLHGATKKDAEHYFPELKESEDEKIRKRIIHALHGDVLDMEETNKAISWLEKQGEQKQDPCDNCKDVMLNCHNFPCIKKRAFKQGKSAFEVINEEDVDNANKVEQKSFWSEEDERQWNNIFDVLDGHFELSEEGYKNAANWFKAIKGRVQPQPKQEWSEEDEKILSDIIKDLVHPWNEYIPDRIEDEIKWLKNRLKSLRPQNTWKPSDEQMKELSYAVSAMASSRFVRENDCCYNVLKSLRDQLKKLK